MSVKSWVHGRINGLVGRGDLPPREPSFDAAPDAPPPSFGHSQAAAAAARAAQADVVLVQAEHLGSYAALIGAVRDELEHFVASHVRLHLAIADRDRFVLTSVAVRCREDGAARQRLAGFVREFKPEQIKRYLARDVIGALPNAAAIDLSQFAGLCDADDVLPAAADEGGEYRELLEALRSTPAPVATRPYEVSVLGRWVEIDAARALPSSSASTVSPRGQAAPGASPTTPMAGQRCEFELEDADGRRRVVLQTVVPGRRYVVGKGEGCDIRVNSTYASRRHAELWLDDGRWWVADAGSTNGLRVEVPDGSPERSDVRTARAEGSDDALALPDGARIVLSARAVGPANDYAWLSLCVPAAGARRGGSSATHPAATPITPIAAVVQVLPSLPTSSNSSNTKAATAPQRPVATPSTPLTAIMVARPSVVLSLTAEHASGTRTLGIHPGMLPFCVGRSRNQDLVIDRRHEGVSGQHLEIVELDASGAMLLVHGDNGLWLDGVRHGPGTRVRWTVGQALLLGDALPGGENCRLSLAQIDEPA